MENILNTSNIQLLNIIAGVSTFCAVWLSIISTKLDKGAK